MLSHRLKATLERLQRLTEAYSEELLELLPPVANALGAALGVAQHAITTFTEAEIRANVVFQVRWWVVRLGLGCGSGCGTARDHDIHRGRDQGECGAPGALVVGFVGFLACKLACDT
jgi:hypothetical protein